MAEELDIRSIWKNSKEKTAVQKIDFTEGKKTKTTLYWVKFILWIEFWMSVVGVVPFTYYFFQEGQHTLAIIYLVITIVYLLYYQFLIRQINSFRYDGNVVESLRKVYRYLWFYLLHYKIVIWLSLILGVLMGISEPQNAQNLEAFSGFKQWAIFIGIVGVMIGIVGGLLHWLIHLIYGRKIKRLRNTVRDLESKE